MGNTRKYLQQCPKCELQVSKVSDKTPERKLLNIHPAFSYFSCLRKNGGCGTTYYYSPKYDTYWSKKDGKDYSLKEYQINMMDAEIVDILNFILKRLDEIQLYPPGKNWTPKRFAEWLHYQVNMKPQSNTKS